MSSCYKGKKTLEKSREFQGTNMLFGVGLCSCFKSCGASLLKYSPIKITRLLGFCVK